VWTKIRKDPIVKERRKEVYERNETNNETTMAPPSQYYPSDQHRYQQQQQQYRQPQPQPSNRGGGSSNGGHYYYHQPSGASNSASNNGHRVSPSSGKGGGGGGGPATTPPLYPSPSPSPTATHQHYQQRSPSPLPSSQQSVMTGMSSSQHTAGTNRTGFSGYSTAGSSTTMQQSAASDESWRRPGKHFRARLLLKDKDSAFTLNQKCAIDKYYQVADRVRKCGAVRTRRVLPLKETIIICADAVESNRLELADLTPLSCCLPLHRLHGQVLEQFLQHPIDTRDDLIEAYLIGSRLSNFLSQLLPTHPSYFSNQHNLCLLRDRSQKQMVDLVSYIEQIAVLIDRQEHQAYISKVLRQPLNNKQGDRGSGRRGSPVDDQDNFVDPNAIDEDDDDDEDRHEENGANAMEILMDTTAPLDVDGGIGRSASPAPAAALSSYYRSGGNSNVDPSGSSSPLNTSVNSASHASLASDSSHRPLLQLPHQVQRPAPHNDYERPPRPGRPHLLPHRRNAQPSNDDEDEDDDSGIVAPQLDRDEPSSSHLHRLPTTDEWDSAWVQAASSSNGDINANSNNKKRNIGPKDDDDLAWQDQSFGSSSHFSDDSGDEESASNLVYSPRVQEDNRTSKVGKDNVNLRSENLVDHGRKGSSNEHPPGSYRSMSPVLPSLQPSEEHGKQRYDADGHHLYAPSPRKAEDDVDRSARDRHRKLAELAPIPPSSPFYSGTTHQSDPSPLRKPSPRTSPRRKSYSTEEELEPSHFMPDIEQYSVDQRQTMLSDSDKDVLMAMQASFEKDLACAEGGGSSIPYGGSRSVDNDSDVAPKKQACANITAPTTHTSADSVNADISISTIGKENAELNAQVEQIILQESMNCSPDLLFGRLNDSAFRDTEDASREDNGDVVDFASDVSGEDSPDDEGCRQLEFAQQGRGSDFGDDRSFPSNFRIVGGSNEPNKKATKEKSSVNPFEDNGESGEIDGNKIPVEDDDSAFDDPFYTDLEENERAALVVIGTAPVVSPPCTSSGPDSKTALFPGSDSVASESSPVAHPQSAARAKKPTREEPPAACHSMPKLEPSRRDMQAKEYRRYSSSPSPRKAHDGKPSLRHRDPPVDLDDTIDDSSTVQDYSSSSDRLGGSSSTNAAKSPFLSITTPEAKEARPGIDPPSCHGEPPSAAAMARTRIEERWMAAASVVANQKKAFTDSTSHASPTSAVAFPDIDWDADRVLPMDDEAKKNKSKSQQGDTCAGTVPGAKDSHASNSSSLEYDGEDLDVEMVNAFLIKKRRPISSHFRGCVRCLLDG